MSILCHLSRLESDMFLSIRALFPCSATCRYSMWRLDVRIYKMKIACLGNSRPLPYQRGEEGG